MKMANSDSFSEEYHRLFKQNIFPSNWRNPKPKEQYDLLVVGGGPGGMTAATFARSFNYDVALVEKEHLGGECLSYGCIPSKAFLRSSRVAQEIRKASEFGLDTPKDWSVNFQSVMQRVYRLQTTLSPHDSAEHFEKLGIDVFLGAGRLTGQNELDVGDQIIHFKKAIIVTGTEPIPLNVSGLNSSDYLTNENIFEISKLPTRLGVIGGGPIGCELAQAFLRFGSQVTLITHAPHLLPRDDLAASERLKKFFENEGMKIFTQSAVQKVEKRGKEKILYVTINNTTEHIVVDELLIAIGRKPAIEGLNLEDAGVTYDGEKGILTNDYLQTNNPDIYAAGDVAFPYKFTHISQELAKMAVVNALDGNQEKGSSLIIPWCTYTDPEVAHIGLDEQEAKQHRIAIETVMIEMADIDRAILDGETTGFVKLLVKENNNQIVGATIMAAHAGDMISEVSVAMHSENGLLALSKAIHPFPTQAQVLRVAADTLLKKRNLLQEV